MTDNTSITRFIEHKLLERSARDNAWPMLDMFDLRIHRSQTRRRPRSFGTPTVDKTHNDWCKYNNPGAGHLVDGTVNGASSCPQRDERRQFQQRRDGEARKPTDVDVSDWTKRPRQ